MNRVAIPLVVLLIATACSSTSEEGTTTSAAELVPSTDAPVSTTASTTADGSSTTSTRPEPTTTTEIPGTWAELPLVTYGDWGGIALGWWDGDSWVQVSAETTLPVSGGETYQIAVLGSDSLTEGGPQQNDGCDVVQAMMPGVQLADENSLGAVIDDGRGGERSIEGVAISAPWDIHPNPTVPGESHPDLENIAFDLLADLGFTTDSVSIVQVLDSDLDGDGTPETLVVAESTELANQASGVYSLMFAVSPSWEDPLVIAESVIPATEEGFPESYRVSDVADLNGDGVMEVIVDGLGWEVTWVGVHELTADGFEPQIGAGCGV